MARIDNFNAGPAALPLPVLERAQQELIDFEGTGMSIMEHSHRGKAYEKVHNEAIALLRKLLVIPETYDVLFLQGGASQQFAMIPMNLLPAGKSADYVVTGGWAEKAYKEAKNVGKVRIAASTEVDGKFTRIPQQSELQLDPEAAYVHTTSNNTLFGTQWHWTADTGNVPHVCDMSSDFLWKPFDVTKYGLIYAGAQKNIGPSGVVVVIVRKDLVAAGRSDIPVIFRYGTHASNNSLYNTANTWGIYVARNVLSWLDGIGGLPEMERRNRAKGELLYGALDRLSDYYKAPVAKDSRSYMNVVFRLPSEALETAFVKEAQAKGLVGLAGHRSTGGVRASIYNAVSLESVGRLVAFMEDFAKRSPAA
jgi:phosphoserine aminotransferase